jgi:hypothetical protein
MDPCLSSVRSRRLLSLILGREGNAATNSAAAAGQLAELRPDVAALSNAVGEVVAKAAPADGEMLQAIRGYQADLGARLDGIGQRIAEGFAKLSIQLAEVKAALDKPQVAPVKEPAIHLPNTHKEIVARDPEPQALLEALRAPAAASLSAGDPGPRGHALKFQISPGWPVSITHFRIPASR